LCIGKGLPTSAGAATGKTVFTSEKAKELCDLGEHTILIRQETSSDDIIGLHSCTGILTMKGGMTSHVTINIYLLSLFLLILNKYLFYSFFY
jgi:pyruvate,orthophosphate dikinase